MTVSKTPSLVSYVGMDANATHQLRTELSEKNINMMVVKNSLARRATEGTSIAPAFEGANGQVAVCWGSTDFVSLVKEIVRLDKNKELSKSSSPMAASWMAKNWTRKA